MSNYQLFRVVTAAAIYNDQKQFLLAKRHAKDEHQPGIWAVPAGHIEVESSDTDTLESNLQREVMEEIGVEIGNLQYLDSHSWVDPEYKKVTVVFMAEIKSGEPKANDETDEVRWLGADKIKDLELAPHVERFLNKAAKELDW